METGTVAMLMIGSLLATGTVFGVAMGGGMMGTNGHMIGAGGHMTYSTNMDHMQGDHEDCDQLMEDWEHEHCEEFEECELEEHAWTDCAEHVGHDHEDHGHCGMR